MAHVQCYTIPARNSIVIKNFTKKGKEGIIAAKKTMKETTTCCSQQQSPKFKQDTKKVRFSTVHIYEHGIIPGDNPACSSGIPLTIEWKCMSSRVETISSLLERKEGQQDAATICTEEGTVSAATIDSSCYHRNYLQMRVPAKLREKWLLDMGYTRQQLVALNKPVNIARAQRRRTVETLNLSPIQETLERAKKQLGKLTLNPKQRQEIKRLKEWRMNHSSNNNNNPVVVDELSKSVQRRRSSIATTTTTNSSMCSLRCSSLSCFENKKDIVLINKTTLDPDESHTSLTMNTNEDSCGDYGNYVDDDDILMQL